VALYSRGDGERAIEALDTAHHRWPTDRDILLALATIQRSSGNAEAALRHARALRDLDPDDRQAQALLQELERRDAGTARPGSG